MIQAGLSFPPFTYTLAETKCAQFAAAIGDELHRLPGGRYEAPVGSVFFVAAQDSGAVFRRLGLGWPDVLFGGLDLVYGRPLRAGETISGQTVVAGCRERGEGAGRLGLVQLRTEYLDEADEPVLQEVSTLIVSRGAGPRTDGPAAPVAGDAAPDQATFSHLVTRLDIAWMAVAVTDPNPIHVEDEVARQAGFRSVIAHGTFPVGAIGAAVARRYGAGRTRLLSVRLTAPTYPGDTILATAVEGRGPSTLDVAAVARGRLLAKGTVELDRDGQAP